MGNRGRKERTSKNGHTWRNSEGERARRISQYMGEYQTTNFNAGKIMPSWIRDDREAKRRWKE